VTSLFTPVFFATMALHYDFVSEFDAGLVAIVVVIASIAKVGGAALGARLGGIANRAAWAIGFGMNSRGAMEILLASVALDAKIINEKMFVALVIMAITTSIISGPAMARLLKVGGLEAAAGQGASRTEPNRAAGSHDLVSNAPKRLS
jgi:Kef-type K+ transport system membrane component KefB